MDAVVFALLDTNIIEESTTLSILISSKTSTITTQVSLYQFQDKTDFSLSGLPISEHIENIPFDYFSFLKLFVSSLQLNFPFVAFLSSHSFQISSKPNQNSP
jgi:hypothetical protein